MAHMQLGRTLVIANPAAHSGKGRQATERVRSFFDSYRSATSSFDIDMTHAPLDGVEIARQSSGMDTVIALGGDGIIHEVVNGLMAIDERDRPRLGIIPMGTGNDFARTLGVRFNDPDKSLLQTLSGHERSIELGRVISDSEPTGPAGTEGSYFMETLSFGLDAAIALDTTDKRDAGTKQEGSSLFITSSIKIFARSSKGYPCIARIDGGEPMSLPTLIFAVQNGPTYGAGYRICPDANPTDGMLDLCANTKRAFVPRLLFLLALARGGHHTRSRIVHMQKARHIELEFTDREPPCQIDGERLTGMRYAIDVIPQALRVIVPQDCAF